MCTCAIINKMCYHRLPQKALEDNHWFPLLTITLGKNPHACFLKSTFTKREQFRTEHYYLKSGFNKTKQNKKHLNMTCRENWATRCHLNNSESVNPMSSIPFSCT